MAYITSAELKTYGGVSGSGDDTLLAALISAAQKAIDAHCHRSFEETSATRYYATTDRRRGQGLCLDADLLTVTTLTNGESSVIPSTGYWLEPRNEPPYQMIRLKSSYVWNFNTDGEISVAGTWGWSATAPDDIKQATKRLATYFYKQKDAQVFDVTAMPDAGVITVPQGIPKDVLLLLEPYRRRTM
jgi:hypothetical protein